MAIATEGMASQIARNQLNSKEARDRAEYEETLRRNNEILAARGHINPPDIVEPVHHHFRTEKQQAVFEAEIAAGKAALERHAARQAARPKVERSQKEIAAEGSSTPVFRPDTFREYKETFNSPVQTISKDHDVRGKPLVVKTPEGDDLQAVHIPTPSAPARPLKFEITNDTPPEGNGG